MTLSNVLEQLARGESLTAEDAQAAFDAVMAGEASPVQIAALLMGLRVKGATPEELAGGVRALRGAMIPVTSPSADPWDRLVDTCGTGGGSVTTFNISTAGALVAAAAGARVAKHGNRSFSSKSGSADVLEALGVTIALSPEAMGRVLDEVGIVFMFAPLLHPAMRHAGPVRRELGIPTLMNLLGPLTNPAGVRRQIVGVADPGQRLLVAEGLRALGHTHALVVHGAPGIDEISPLGATAVVEVRDGEVREWSLHPEDVGLPVAQAQEIAGGTPEENAAVILGVLEGRLRGGARSVTLLNAGAALYVAGVASDVGDGVRRAAEVLDHGAARARLEALVHATGRFRDVAS
jgi:anthranilate phosphoribosyltransferase